MPKRSLKFWARKKMIKKISGYVDVPALDRANFERALPEHSRLTNAEPGCIFFEVIKSSNVEGRYIVNETFDDEAAYQAHVDRTQQTEWFEITRNIKRSYKTT